MKLSDLISDINTEMRGKIASNPEIGPEEAEKTAKQVALAALKYGDLSNQASKDYIFDIERFTSFEGDTGPISFIPSSGSNPFSASTRQPAAEISLISGSVWRKARRRRTL